MKAQRERALGRWLPRHHGVITLAEAGRIGLSANMLSELTAQGRLTRVHRGVYAEAPLREEPALTASAAALAATEPHGALSHRSAAWLWGLVEAPPSRVDLLLPPGSRSRLQGVHVHRSRTPHTPRSVNGLRLTDPARTVLDLATVAPTMLPGVVDGALSTGLLRITDLEALTRPDADHRRPGSAQLRRHLNDRGYLGAPLPSVLESLMAREVFHRYALATPRVEVEAGWFGQYRLDYAYPEVCLAVEVDGYVWHSGPEHMAADNARRNHLRTIGWHLLVYTWLQVTREPGLVAAEIRANYERLTGI